MALLAKLHLPASNSHKIESISQKLTKVFSKENFSEFFSINNDKSMTATQKASLGFMESAFLAAAAFLS